MAQYAIILYTPKSQWADQPSKEEQAAHSRHADELISSGSMVAAFALENAETTATSIRGDAVTDGPFVDAKEVIAGICIVEAPDLDAALKIGRSNPINQQGGGVEVRPVVGGYVAERTDKA